MATNVILKRSSVPNKVPPVSGLNLGELAFNTNDGRVFAKRDNGNISIIEIGTLPRIVEETSSSSYTPDLQYKNYFEYIFTGNSVIERPLNFEKGHIGKFILRMDDVGGFDADFNSVFQIPGNYNLLKDAGAVNIFEYIVLSDESIYLEYKVGFVEDKALLGNSLDDLYANDSDALIALN